MQGKVARLAVGVLVSVLGGIGTGAANAAPAPIPPVNGPCDTPSASPVDSCVKDAQQDVANIQAGEQQAAGGDPETGADTATGAGPSVAAPAPEDQVLQEDFPSTAWSGSSATTLADVPPWVTALPIFHDELAAGVPLSALTIYPQ